jgi:hypothetical protein
MIETDREFLLWLAKRLVYKYGEKPEIISQMMGLINRNRSKYNAYEENLQNMLLFISGTIDSLTNMQKICANLTISNQTDQKLTDQNIQLFDTIDMDNFIKGV